MAQDKSSPNWLDKSEFKRNQGLFLLFEALFGFIQVTEKVSFSHKNTAKRFGSNFLLSSDLCDVDFDQFDSSQFVEPLLAVEHVSLARLCRS